MAYIVTPTELPGVLILEPEVHVDARGYFFESFNQRNFAAATGLQHVHFVQDNQSYSMQNVLRGLHYQIQHPQGKLVRAIVGTVFNVAVDLRRSSPYFGRWTGVELSARNRRQLWVPPGFAPGFLVRSTSAEILYKTTDYWYPVHERVLYWCDPALAIDWSLCHGAPILSARDRAGATLSDAEVYD